MLSNTSNFSNMNKSNIIIPEFLQQRNIQDFDIPVLKEFFLENKILNFAEVNIEMLNQYAKYNYDKAIRVSTILGLYGVVFIGKSAKKYSPNSRNKIILLNFKKHNCKLYQVKIFKQKYKNIELRCLEYFEYIGIANSFQISGINLSVLLDKLNIFDINIDEIINDIDTDYFKVVEGDFLKIYSNSNENLLAPGIKNKSVSEEIDIPIEQINLSIRTRNLLIINGIDTLEKLKKIDFEEFKKRRNVGKGVIDEIICYLCSKGDTNLYNNNQTKKNTKSNIDVSAVIKTEEIDERIYNYNLDELGLSSDLIDTLKGRDVKTVGDFLESKILLANVGTFKIKPRDVNIIYEKLEKFGINKFVKYAPVHIETPKCYYNKITDEFNDDWIVNACQKYEIKNIGLLASVFPDIFSKDELLVEQDLFYEKMQIIQNKLKEFGIIDTPIKLSYFQKNDLNKKNIQELININYIKLVADEVDKIISQNIQLNEREIDIISKYYAIGYESKMTLEKIGQEYGGISRERVRQLIAKAIKKIQNLLLSKYPKINEDISNLFAVFGSIIAYPKVNLISGKFLSDILKDMKNLEFCIDLDNFYVLQKKLKIEDVENKILKSLGKANKTFNSNEIKQAIKNVLDDYVSSDTSQKQSNYSVIFENIYSKLLVNDFINIDEDLYKIPSKGGNRLVEERNDKLIYWFKKLFPNGAHLPIEKEKEEQVLKTLQPLYEQCPEIKGLNIRGLCDRLFKNKNGDIIWWGRGLYIHVDNIQIDWDVVDFAIKEIIKKFDSGIYRLKPKLIYDEYKDKFLKANIPNEIALVGLIRYKNNPRINTKRDELRDAKNSNLKLNILETLENYILKYPDGINKKDLLHEMCDKRGWQKYQIDLLYTRSNLIYSDYGIYYHKNNLTIDKDKLSEIINLIQKELNESNSAFIHLRKIQNKYPATWVGVLNKNISPCLMGRLLSSVLINKDIVIDNYIYVKRIEHSEQSLSMLNILSDFVEEKSLENRYVTISEIFDFCQKQGMKDTKQPIVDCLNNFSFEYSDEPEAYVHKNVLGYSEEFQEDIFALIQKLSEVDYELPFISYEDIIIEFRDFLPTLNDGYDWNIYLLRSALSSDENLDIFDKTFIFKDNKFGVEDLDDAAAYLIMKNFENGYCKFKDLDKLMARFGVTQYKNLHLYKSKLFFEGSSIKLVDNDTAVAVEKFARKKYSNV